MRSRNPVTRGKATEVPSNFSSECHETASSVINGLHPCCPNVLNSACIQCFKQPVRLDSLKDYCKTPGSYVAPPNFVRSLQHHAPGQFDTASFFLPRSCHGARCSLNCMPSWWHCSARSDTLFGLCAYVYGLQFPKYQTQDPYAVLKPYCSAL